MDGPDAYLSLGKYTYNHNLTHMLVSALIDHQPYVQNGLSNLTKV